MFEANLSGGKFLNQGNVDFFSIAYTLAATRNTGEQVTVGITTPSETVFQEFAAIPSPADSAQHSGNTEIFKALIVKNAAGQTVRVVAPKAAALGNLNADDALPQMFTHFLDDYVNNHCWRPNREFSFSSKLAGDTATYYGKVSADGLTLSIYTDAALTVPYAVPTLPRPSNAWGNPDFKNRGYLWHNVGVTSTLPANIDWGYLLYGQDGYPAGPGAHWITDPVAMSIPVSIVRGVMHLDNGTVDWKDSAKYYQGTNGASTADFPVFYYGKILHQLGLAGKVYALSFDDVYGTDSGIGFTNPDVTLALYPFSAAPLGPGITANGVATNLTVNYPEPVSVAVTLNPGEFAGLLVDWWFIAYAHSGEWFYLDRNVQWPSFGGDFTLCRPVYQGPLFNLSSFTVLDSLPLPRGTYDFWFAVDYPMDGILFPNMALMFDHVTVVVQ